ncbi:unnamed protein product [Strongylus vulgaris]|uniref:Uncharacterized protein n=1 Tax=Strongylus vulgaris TaxID=40348 RepID=A0A3P7JFR2_STRVU|nr:unnamed protein product [Strongylus vulgaris]
MSHKHCYVVATLAAIGSFILLRLLGSDGRYYCSLRDKPWPTSLFWTLRSGDTCLVSELI